MFPRSLGFLKFRRDGDRVYGPGVLDMKSGLTSVLFALRAIRSVDPARFAGLPIRFIVVSDEEVGSPSSVTMYRELAPRLTAGLVFESGREGDTIVTRARAAASTRSPPAARRRTPATTTPRGSTRSTRWRGSSTTPRA